MRTKTPFLVFKNTLKDYPVFSTFDVSKAFPNLHRRRLYEWEKKGLLKRVTKGYYMFSDIMTDEDLLYLIANRIYRPSYISLQSALNWYGFIPEYVPHVTSVSTKKTTILCTELGNFSYASLKEPLMFGYDLVSLKDGKYKIKMAYPEKALLDMIYLNSNLFSEAQFSELRLNKELLSEKVSKKKLQQYVSLFENKAFEKRANNFMEYLEHA